MFAPLFTCEYVPLAKIHPLTVAFSAILCLSAVFITLSDMDHWSRMMSDDLTTDDECLELDGL